MKTVFTITAAILAFTLLTATVEASDPAGTWTTCRHYTGTPVIIVDGPRCPRGFTKQY